MEQLITVVLFGGMWWWASRTMLRQKHEIIVLRNKLETYETSANIWTAYSDLKKCEEQEEDEDMGLQ